MHWIVFVPCDAPKPVSLFGPGIRLIVMIVWIPGGGKHKTKNRNTILKIIMQEKRMSGGKFISHEYCSFTNPICLSDNR